MMLTEQREQLRHMGFPGIDFNSPGHESFQDGSFMHDDFGMHLMDLRPFNSIHRASSDLCIDWQFGNSASFQPTSVLTASWILRGKAKWATDFDANIAQLDFDNVDTSEILTNIPEHDNTCQDSSTDPIDMQASLELSIDGSLFSSMVGFDTEQLARQLAEDGTFISTDSLNLSAFDPDLLHAVCATKKDDYVLTFADLPMDDSCAVVQVSSDDRVNQQLTTWGRIKRSFEQEAVRYRTPKSASLPLLHQSSAKVPIFDLNASIELASERPTSLLNAFQNRLSDRGGSRTEQDSSSGYGTDERRGTSDEPGPSFLDDFEYSEEYVGDGRYVDLNQNEIGFVPSSTAGVQRSSVATTFIPPSDHCATRPSLIRISPVKSPRTFTTLLRHSDNLVDQPLPFDNFSQSDLDSMISSSNAPDLSFLKMTHYIPTLFSSSSTAAAVFPLAFLVNDSTSDVQKQIENELTKRLKLSMDGKIDSSLLTQTMAAALINPDYPRVTQTRKSSERQFIEQQAILDGNSNSSKKSNDVLPHDRDSGLGASGPTHIQDWDSLAVLLPKNVTQAYSFFKANSQLLGQQQESNDIERPSKNPRSEPKSHCRNKSTFESIYEEKSQRICCPCHSKTPTQCSNARDRHCTGHHHAPLLCCCSCFSSSCCPAPCPPISESTPCLTFRCHSRHGRNYCCQSSNLFKWRHANHDDDQRESTDNSDDPRKDEEYSNSSDDDEGLRGLRMTSEYQLRERDGTVQPFSSLRSVIPQKTDPIDSVRPCTTCFSLRTPTSIHPPVWAHPPSAKHILCDCQTSDILQEQDWHRTKWRICNFGDVHPQEIKVRNTPIYQQKKKLIDAVENACQQMISAFDAFQSANVISVQEALSRTIGRLVENSLCPCIEEVVADGLMPNANPWQLIRKSITLGPATKSVHQLVTDLISMHGQCAGEDDDNGGRVVAFIQGLLSLHSLDCWFSYLAIKSSLLRQFYDQSAFLLHATHAYQSQFSRLVTSLQTLNRLTFDSHLRRLSLEMTPTRLPGDSRVPKSSSVPERLAIDDRKRTNSVDAGLVGSKPRPSLIPVLMKASVPVQFRCHSQTVQSPSNNSCRYADFEWPSIPPINGCHFRLVRAVEDVARDPALGLLDLIRGERLQVLQKSLSGQYLRCRRLDKCTTRIQQGLVEYSKIAFITIA